MTININTNIIYYDIYLFKFNNYGAWKNISYDCGLDISIDLSPTKTDFLTNKPNQNWLAPIDTEESMIQIERTVNKQTITELIKQNHDK